MTRWRAVALIAVHLLAAAHFVHWRLAGRTLAPVEPSEMFDTLHLGVVTVGFLFMAGVVVATACFGRFFCGWGCHVLALQDLSAWLLAKLRVPVRPIRSRTLVWAPLAVAVYLLAWPQVERLARGESLPELRIVSDRDEWTSLVTDDLLRSFPGPAMTVVTFVVCGFAIVYFLGSRSFCAYACPYGAVFAAVDRVSPLRVVAGPGACSDCGLCTAGCKSSVRVIEEVRRHGTVIDSSCFKDLDCVSACPTGAIQLGWTTPPALLGRATRAKKPYDFTRGEEAILAGAFAVTLAITRGLYDSVSLLLALALSAIVAYGAVIGWRLLRRSEVRASGTTLKTEGRLTARGRAVTLGLAAAAALVAHSGIVRTFEFSGEAAAARLSALEAGGADPVQLHAAAEEAFARLERCARWGLVTPAGWRRQLAALALRAGRPTEARRHAVALVAADPADYTARLLTAQAWLAEGRTSLAREQAQRVADDLAAQHSKGPAPLRQRRVLGAAHFLLGDVAGRGGDVVGAMRSFESSIAAYSKHADAQFALGTLYERAGRVAEARVAYEKAVAARPRFAAASEALARLEQR